MLLMTNILIQKKNIIVMLLLNVIKDENVYTPLHIHELGKEAILAAL